MPRTAKQYPRSGVTASSTTMSSSPTTGRASAPTGASAGSTMIPPWSSPSASSRAEQIMPSETRPYVRRAVISKPPGNTVPGRATTTASPTEKFAAPQMIPRGAASPTSTWQYRIGFLVPATSSMASTRPTTSGPATVVRRSAIDSTSRPTRTSAASSSSALRSAGSSTYSRSQDSDTRTSDLHPERAGEPGVALDHVAHVRHPVAEHERALDAHAEGEPGVLVGIDAAGAPLDPARPVPVLREPQVHLGRRFGEREVRRPQPRLRLRPEHGPREVVQRAPQVRHRDAAVDDKAFDLVEHRRVGRVQLVGAVHAPRADDVDRRPAVEHDPRLDRRRMGTQHQIRLVDVEGVHHGARRMVGCDVQRVEVEPFELDLGPLGDLVAHADEQVADALHQRGQRV